MVFNFSTSRVLAVFLIKFLNFFENICNFLSFSSLKDLQDRNYFFWTILRTICFGTPNLSSQIYNNVYSLLKSFDISRVFQP